MKTNCAHCNKEFEIYIGHYNRAKKLGRPVYCDKICSGFGRRKHKTEEQKKREKAEYDKIYSEKNKEKKKRWVVEYRKRPHVKELERQARKRRSAKHSEYCRQPEYKKWKKEYDLQRQAKLKYDEYWESAVALRKIENEIDRHQANMENQTYNKSQKRKRLCQTKRNSLPTVLKMSSGTH